MEKEEPTFRESVLETIEKTSPSLPPKQQEKLVETIENALLKGIPVKDSLGINDDTIEFLYSQGHRLFSTHKYGEAAKLFQVMYLLNPIDPRYALGIAASFQKAKEYEKAIAWYITLSIIDEATPLPFYYISDCFLKQGYTEAALEYLNKAVERCGDIPKYSSLKAKALMMMEPLKEETQKAPAKKEK